MGFIQLMRVACCGAALSSACVSRGRKFRKRFYLFFAAAVTTTLCLSWFRGCGDDIFRELRSNMYFKDEMLHLWNEVAFKKAHERAVSTQSSLIYKKISIFQIDSPEQFIECRIRSSLKRVEGENKQQAAATSPVESHENAGSRPATSPSVPCSFEGLQRADGPCGVSASASNLPGSRLTKYLCILD